MAIDRGFESKIPGAKNIQLTHGGARNTFFPNKRVVSDDRVEFTRDGRRNYRFQNNDFSSTSLTITPLTVRLTKLDPYKFRINVLFDFLFVSAVSVKSRATMTKTLGDAALLRWDTDIFPGGSTRAKPLATKKSKFYFLTKCTVRNVRTSEEKWFPTGAGETRNYADVANVEWQRILDDVRVVGLRPTYQSFYVQRC